MEIDDFMSDLLNGKLETESSISRKDTIEVKKDVSDEINLPEIVSLPYIEVEDTIVNAPTIVTVVPKKDKFIDDKTIISQSLIMKMFDKGNLKNYCKKYIKRLFIDKDIKSAVSDAMKYGLYGEQLMIGSSAHDNEKMFLDKNKRSCKDKLYLSENGSCVGCKLYHDCAKTAVQQKIELQAEIFKKKCEEMGINIQENINTQLTIYKRFPNEPDFIVGGTMDVFPVFAIIEDEMEICLFDIKFTQKISSSFGYAKWGEPAELDFIQLNMYHYLLKDIDFSINTHLTEAQILILKFAYHYIQNHLLYRFYWVFEYGTTIEEMRDLIIPVDKWSQPYSDLVEMEVHEIVRTTINEIKNNNVMGLWDDEIPCYMCDYCPMKMNCETFNAQL